MEKFNSKRNTRTATFIAELTLNSKLLLSYITMTKNLLTIRHLILIIQKPREDRPAKC